MPRIVKRIVIGLVVLSALIAATFGVMHWVLIDRTTLTEELQQAVRTSMGRELALRGDAETVLFPLPHIVLRDITIANAEGASSEAMLHVEEMELGLNFSALMSGEMEISSVVLKQPKLDMEVFSGNSRNWHLRDASGAVQGRMLPLFNLEVPLEIENGTISYTNLRTTAAHEIAIPEGSFAKEAGADMVVFKGAVKFAGGEAATQLRMGRIALSAAQSPNVPFELKMQDGELTLEATGALYDAVTAPRFEGKIHIQSSDMWAIEPYVFDGARYFFGRVGTVQALNIEGDVVLTEEALSSDQLNYLVGSPGGIPLLKGNAALRWGFGREPVLQMRALAETVDLDSWVAMMDSVGKSEAGETANEAAADKDSLPVSGENLWAQQFPQSLQAALDLRADAAIFHQRVISNGRLQAGLSEGRLNISSLSASLPGEAQMSLSGSWVLNGQEGSTFEGPLSISGASLNQFLLLFTKNDYQEETHDFGSFALKTNIAVIPEQFRFSEVQAQVNSTQAGGAVIFHRKDDRYLESFLRLRNINFDHVWGLAKHFLPETLFAKVTQKQTDGLETKVENPRFNWLQSLPFRVLGNVLIDDFVLLERKGENTNFTLKINPGYLGFEKLEGRYNGSDIAGDYALLSERNLNPKIVAKGKIETLDIVDIFPQMANTLTRADWQELLDQQRDFAGLHEYRADLDLRFGDLRASPFMFSDLHAVVGLEDGLLSIKTWQGKLWDGPINLNGQFQASTISAGTFNFVLGAADLVDINRAIPWLSRMTGKVGIRGNVNISGARLRTMVENAAGIFTVSGSNIAVEGFGLDTISRGLLESRTVADFIKARDLAMRSGLTLFDTLEGQINLQRGMLEAPGLNFTSRIASGVMRGKLDILQEDLQLAININLMGTGIAASPPPIQLLVSGNVADPDKALDSKDLEAFVARTAAERSLRITP